MILSGTMSSRVRFTCNAGVVFYTVVFIAAAILNVRLLLLTGQIPILRLTFLVSLACVVLIAWATRSQFFLRHRIIDHFEWDGHAFRFRTISGGDSELRDIFEIQDLSDWRLQGRLLGSKIQLRDGRQFYFSSTIPNAAAVQAEIRRLLKQRT